MIKIKSKQAGFRRCGIAHPATNVLYSDDRFTAAELAILQAEPMLIVTVAPDSPPAPVLPPVIPAEAGIQADAVTDEAPTAAPADVKPKGKGKK